MQSSSNRQIALVTAILALALAAWDLSGLDLKMAQWFGGPAGFPLQDNWWLTHVLHDGASRLAWGFVVLLCVGAWLPAGLLGRLPSGRRLQLAATTLMAVTVVSGLKTISVTSCPWSLAEFGGVARYTSHWAHLFTPDGGSGGCFPAGHASSGFAFLGGYFAFRDTSPGIARKWLAASILAGLVLGVAQQVRGAHFMSHTLWTGLICWCVAWAMHGVFSRFELKDMTVDAPDQIEPAMTRAT